MPDRDRSLGLCPFLWVALAATVLLGSDPGTRDGPPTSRDAPFFDDPGDEQPGSQSMLRSTQVIAFRLFAFASKARGSEDRNRMNAACSDGCAPGRLRAAETGHPPARNRTSIQIDVLFSKGRIWRLTRMAYLGDMTHVVQHRPSYTRAERMSDGIVHVLGVTAAVAAVPVLITLSAVWHSEPSAILGASVYGGTLIAMLLFSALYNMIDHADWAPLLRRLDHVGIYLKIAGTYTPFTLLSGGQAGWLLTGLWGAALAGSGLKIANPFGFRWICLGLYLAMGWAGVLVGGTFLGSLSPAVLILVLIGGILYTGGVVFLLWESLPHHNTIWHVFVLLASGVFFAAVMAHVAQANG